LFNPKPIARNSSSNIKAKIFQKKNTPCFHPSFLYPLSSSLIDFQKNGIRLEAVISFHSTTPFVSEEAITIPRIGLFPSFIQLATKQTISRRVNEGSILLGQEI